MRIAVVGFLSLAAVGQIGFMITRDMKPDPANVRSAAAQLVEGSRVPQFNIQLDTATTPNPFRLANEMGSATLVMAFNSQCVHCDRVAPAWSAWLATQPDVRMIAITNEPVNVGEAYASRHQWRVQVASVVNAPAGAVERQLVSRTPWLFVFDANGILRTARHGARLMTADSVLAALQNDDT